MTAKRFSRILSSAALILAFIFGAAMSVSCMLALIDDAPPLMSLMSPIITVSLIVFAAFLIFKFSKPSEISLALLVFCISLLIRGAFSLIVRTQPNSDFSTLYIAAESLINGDSSWLFGDYFSLWPYQIPFVIYEAFVLKFFNSIVALKFINILLLSGTSLLIYRLSRLFASQGAALTTAIIYTILPEPTSLVTLLSNQHISLFLMLLGIYIALSSRSKHRFILSGALVSLGDLMRPEGIIVVAPLFLVSLLMIIGRKDKRHEIIKGIFLFIASFFLLRFVFWAALKSAGLAPFGISSGCPEWKFILGLDPDSKGTYNNTHSDILFIQDANVRRAEATSIIKGYFSSPASFARFLWDKTCLYYGGYFDSSWAFINTDLTIISFGNVSAVLVLYWIMVFDRVLFAAAAALAAGACLLGLNDTPSPLLLFCAIVLCAFFCSYLFIEIQPRYRYFISPYLFIMSSYLLNRTRFFSLSAVRPRSH